MARAKYDPLEAAKIGADGEKPKPPATSFKDVDVSDLVEVVLPPRPVPPPTVSARHPRYRVTEPGRVSFDGQICRMEIGTVLDSAGYGGEAGIARLRTQGIKLELVKD